jgi:hypothetical protein
MFLLWPDQDDSAPQVGQGSVSPFIIAIKENKGCRFLGIARNGIKWAAPINIRIRGTRKILLHMANLQIIIYIYPFFKTRKPLDFTILKVMV